LPRTRVHHRDIVVIGASAGGVEALSRLVADLPVDLPAAIFVVLHVSPNARSHLPEILSRRGALPARHALDGDAVERGRILIAPPDRHLVMAKGHVNVVRGPRQNSCRPSIDVLFRSAAASYGSRVVGVVMSGYLDDGASGLRELSEAGGIAVVQDPADALSPEMPDNAIAAAHPRHILRAEDISSLLARLAAGGVEAEGGDSTPGRRRQRLARVNATGLLISGDGAFGSPTGLTCPECHGVLWVGPTLGSPVLHCPVGHAFSPESLHEQQRVSVEQSLWAAVRSLREQAALADNIASRAEDGERPSIGARYRSRERRAREHAAALERLLGDDPGLDEGPRDFA
jgi:two-component system chemotaxis response regulator CheB